MSNSRTESESEGSVSKKNTLGSGESSVSESRSRSGDLDHNQPKERNSDSREARQSVKSEKADTRRSSIRNDEKKEEDKDGSSGEDRLRH